MRLLATTLPADGLVEHVAHRRFVPELAADVRPCRLARHFRPKAIGTCSAANVTVVECLRRNGDRAHIHGLNSF
jgi:hypothetical protein